MAVTLCTATIRVVDSSHAKKSEEQAEVVGPPVTKSEQKHGESTGCDDGETLHEVVGSDGGPRVGHLVEHHAHDIEGGAHPVIYMMHLGLALGSQSSSNQEQRYSAQQRVEERSTQRVFLQLAACHAHCRIRSAIELTQEHETSKMQTP